MPLVYVSESDGLTAEVLRRIEPILGNGYKRKHDANNISNPCTVQYQTL